MTTGVTRAGSWRRGRTGLRSGKMTAPGRCGRAPSSPGIVDILAVCHLARGGFSRRVRHRDRVRSCPPSRACHRRARSAGTPCPSDRLPAMNDDGKLDAQMPNSVLSHTREPSNWKSCGKLTWESEEFTGNLHRFRRSPSAARPGSVGIVRHPLGEGGPRAAISGHPADPVSNGSPRATGCETQIRPKGEGK